MLLFFKSVTFSLSAPEILEFFQNVEHLCKFCIESYGKSPTVSIRRIVYQENYIPGISPMTENYSFQHDRNQNRTVIAHYSP